MISRFTSFLFAVLATISLVSGILLLYPQWRLQNQDLYIYAFNQSEFLGQIQEVIQNNLDSYLEENLKVDENNQFPPGFATIVIRAIIRGMDMDLVIMDTIRENSIYISSWLSGNSKLEFYFPREAIVQSYQGEEGNKRLINNIIEIAGYSNLPDCVSVDQITQASFVRGDISCGGPLLKEFVREEIVEKSGGHKGSLIEVFLSSIAPNLDETTTIKLSDSKLVDDIKLWELPEILSRVKFFGLIAMVLAIITTVISVWLSPYSMKALLKVLLNTSVVLIIFSLVSKVAFRIATDFVLWSKISFSPKIYSQEQIDQILGLFKDFFGVILDKLLLEILIIGFVLLALVIVLYILFRFVGLISPESEEDDDEDEDIDYEDDIEDEGISERDFEKNLLKEQPQIS